MYPRPEPYDDAAAADGGGGGDGAAAAADGGADDSSPRISCWMISNPNWETSWITSSSQSSKDPGSAIPLSSISVAE